jgi:predicted dehydrogenase
MKHGWICCLVGVMIMVAGGCRQTPARFTGAPGKVKLLTLDPGHFHAALVQKSMYEQVSPEVYVYAPEGPDVRGHLELIERYNQRAENPTAWTEHVYTGPDFLERMLREKKGNVVVLAGNNARKTDYIYRCVDAGFHVLADKPMVITPEDFPLQERTFERARANGVLLYDIMTERYEITTILQKELSQIPAVFGELQKGTVDEPAVTKESVHHFFKYVSGKPLRRPAWFFDSAQQGEGLADVSTHLVDLIQWECFPGRIIDKSDIEIISARRWTTPLSREQFSEVTGLDGFPDYLKGAVKDGRLDVYSNGEMNYTINGVHARVSVIWNYEAPEGAGDTHYSIMRGTRCNLIIRQGAEENYMPTLYVEAAEGRRIGRALRTAVRRTLQATYPGLDLERLGEGRWKVVIPDKYRVGHEAHFGEVTEKYLRYLSEGKLPDWETPNMIAKYYTITQALKKARE